MKPIADILFSVSALLEAGAEVDCLVKSSQATPLHMSSLAGNTAVVAALLAGGAKVEARAGESLYGASPLYLAAQNGHTEVVRLLLTWGANIHFRLKKLAVTPLLIAAERGHTEVVRLLLAQGASPLVRNWNGLTALGLTRDQEIVQLLLAGGAEGNSRDNQGNTVILNCVDTDLLAGPHCSLQLLRQLLKAGADPNIRNKDRNLPLILLAAKKVKKVELVLAYMKVLLDHGVDIEATATTEDGPEMTALAAATKNGSGKIVHLLLESGAETNVAMTDKLSPLGWAIRNKNFDLTEQFLQHGLTCCHYRESEEDDCKDLCLDLAVGSRDSDIIKLITKYKGRRKPRNVQDEL